ncbi:hypothetical protein [Pectobacterium brasiliense]|uniref:hypothetical protein n=1 Tax=Pectobacterium brasiliense TaxID=180957 RepID=UPI0015DE2D25|nr:hypothetical protein [Pectobacterium brasiliense]MBA0207685.1 hypothetical protein [Pectobacterium brasiliense]
MKAKIELKTERDVRLFLWLNKNDIAVLNYEKTSRIKKYNVDQIYGVDVSLAENAINEAFSIFYDDSAQFNSYSFVLKRKKEKYLPKIEFDWFKKCHESCYFTWIFIRVFCSKNRFLFDGFVPNNPEVSVFTIYNHLDLPFYPVSHKERFQSIMDFFDRIDLHLVSKMNIMHFIKNEWHRRYHLKDNLPLSKKEKNKCEWLWSYIHKDKNNIVRGSKRRELSVFIKDSTNESMETQFTMHLHSPSFLSLFRPSGYNEIYLALNCIYIFLYYRDPHFISRVRKAWESSVFRKTNKIKSKIKTKVKLKDADEVVFENLRSTKLINPNPSIDEKRMMAKEIMRKITEKANYDTESDGSDDNNESSWFG